MARNEEKAQSLLNRWTSMKQDFADTFKNRRPYLASQCDNLRDAERWRRQLVREISKKVADIQNAGSSEHVIRDLNDDINKRIREKRHWERRIVQLGGSDHKSQPLAYDADGDAVMEVGGYKYFGAAKDLPGVRELFQKDEYEPRKRTRHDMYKHIEPDYYGYRDDEDEQQLKDEEEAENKLRQQAMDSWDAAEAKRKAQVAELVRLQAAGLTY
ncbi:Pre-mRNA-splicing factor ISY1 [Phytophthora megakarya]|uniref:Pre-mRNA-splicing factor ISY1 n=1 Tax=Phytophthora megakarya TaxID=4795 RepID=A0A225W1A3_9STRA|nr:Pre-mRNA-splicing factor ISY1 [Phytophthora megakarya]